MRAKNACSRGAVGDPQSNSPVNCYIKIGMALMHAKNACSNDAVTDPQSNSAVNCYIKYMGWH